MVILRIHLGEKCKSKNSIECMQKAVEYRKADTKKLMIRTDNGPQFKAKGTEACIESHHSVIEREFVQLNEFEYIEDVYNTKRDRM